MKPELSAQLTGFCIFLTFAGGLVFTLLVPSYNENWSKNTAKDEEHYHQPYTAEQQRGRLIYQREGCVYCHTQQIRPLKGEMIRYSIGRSLAVNSDEREYVYDRPHFLGTRRIGPDISREGGKYNDDWQLSHLYNPRQMVTGSIMPSFTWLFDKDPDGNPIPKDDARALVSYIQTLGYQRQIVDPMTHKWRPWLAPEDQQTSQQTGENVLKALPTTEKTGAVRSGDKPSDTNVVTPSTPAPAVKP